MARKLKNLYIGVNGTARAVQKAYVGDADGKARLWYTRGWPIGNAAVGSSVYFAVNGMRTEWLVVQQGNPDANLYDASCAGTWLLAKDLYEKRAWNTNNTNSYGASTIHTYLNGTFLGLLDSGVRRVVRQVKIPYRAGTGTSTTIASGTAGLSTRVFLLSNAELRFNAKQPQGEGSVLAYFASCTVDRADSRRIAKLSGTASAWSLRSPFVVGSGARYAMSGTVTASGGDSGALVTALYGIRPCLILPQTALVDDNKTVIGG